MKKSINRTVSNISVIVIFIGVFLLSVSHAEEQKNIFKLGVEKQISSPNMDCNLLGVGGDSNKSIYNFEYPKLIMPNKGKPIIAFVDMQSANLYLAEIADQNVNILYNQPSLDVNNQLRWPVIFEKGDKVYFAQLSSEGYKKPTSWVKVYLFDKENKKLDLVADKTFKLGNRCELWSIYPYNSNYMLIGKCEYIALRYIPTILLGGVPEFWHNASFLLDSKGDKELTMQSIEEKGCYNVNNQVYDVSKSGAIHAAWIRDTSTFGGAHDEIVYLRTNKIGANWSPPIDLYSVKNVKPIKSYINDHINNLSLASYDNSSYVLWQDRAKGIFFSEINNGEKIELTQIGSTKDINHIIPLASTIKVTADNDGNAYALWAENSWIDFKSYDYKLQFRARINGQWMPQQTINQGSGVVKVPDMKVDKEGTVHITYIKSMSENVPYGKYGCFYMKLERQDKKVQAAK